MCGVKELKGRGGFFFRQEGEAKRIKLAKKMHIGSRDGPLVPQGRWKSQRVVSSGMNMRGKQWWRRQGQKRLPEGAGNRMAGHVRARRKAFIFVNET